MSVDTQHAPGGHYSGRNRIPNIQEFVASLDRDKRERDAQIDAALKENKKNKSIAEHKIEDTKKPGRKVTDPVTGRQVEIEDMDVDYKAVVDNPILSVPNANLGKETTVKTDEAQSGEEYRYNQDVTAPPDPVAVGSTSDVPIHVRSL
jgi:hypothetical protein